MTESTLSESQLGPAERLLDLVLHSSAHLWHNRRGSTSPASGIRRAVAVAGRAARAFGRGCSSRQR
jgi:hypothetical protein